MTTLGRSIVLIGVLGICLLLTVSGICQQTGVSGSFNGTITDQSGAVVPGANVKITNTATNESQQTTAGPGGTYGFSYVSPGTYNITAGFQGFATVTKQGVILLVNQPATVDFVLQPGAVTQQVSISASAPVINTVNSTVATVVSHTQVANLPLNGMQFTQLILLSPGATPRQTSQQATFQLGADYGAISPAVNGARSDQNNFTIDGVENNELFFVVAALSPPTDSIQEFSVQTFITSGGFGRAPGANVNLVTRSGSNQFHGGAWEFVRNDIFDANYFFNNAGGAPRSAFRQNQFGADGGGPILKGKLWTFGWYEGFRKILGSSSTSLVPTPAMLKGDFSAYPVKLYNPYSTVQTGTDSQGNPVFSRTAFTNNIIPSNMLNPSAMALVQRYYPTPNIVNAATGASNFLNTQPITTTYNQFSDRMDMVLPKDTRFFGRFSWFRGDKSTPDAFPAVSPVALKNTTVQAVVGLTKSINPTTVVDFHAQFLRTYPDEFREPPPVSFLTSSGIINDFPAQKGLPPCSPNIALSDFAGLSGCSLLPILTNNWEYNGSVTKIKGKHSINVGGELFRSTDFTVCGYGDASFDNLVTSNPQNPSTTGSGLASFLLGLPSAADREGGDGSQLLYNNIYSAWATDQMKVTPKLTVTLGLRYDYSAPFSDSRGRFGAPDWEKSSAGNIAYLVDQKALKYPDQILTPDHTIHTPETTQTAYGPLTYNIQTTSQPGLVYPSKRDFGPRASIAYRLPHDVVLRTGYAIFYDFNGTGYHSQGAVMGQWPFGLPSFTLSGLNTPTPTNPTPNGVLGQGNLFPPLALTYTPSFGFAEFRHNQSPYLQMWNLGLEKQLPGNWALTVDYLGNKGTHEGGRYAVNTAPTPAPGPVNPRTRIPQVGVVYAEYHGFNSNYNVGEVKLEHRATHGLTTIISYAYGHSIDEASCIHGECRQTQDFLNLRGSRGSSEFDITHNAVASWVYQLPVGKGRRFLDNSGGVANALLGGWQGSGILTLQTGQPYNLRIASDNANIGFGNQRPSVTSLGALLPPGFQQTPQHWFNASALYVTPYTWGNVGRNVLRRDGFQTIDFGLAKITDIPPGWLGGHEGARLEFRAEFFNLTNHPNFDDPVGSGYSPFGGSKGYVSASNVGAITATVGTPRDIQFGLKINF